MIESVAVLLNKNGSDVAEFGSLLESGGGAFELTARWNFEPGCAIFSVRQVAKRLWPGKGGYLPAVQCIHSTGGGGKLATA